MEPLAREILDFWFGDYTLGVAESKRTCWFKKDPKFDQLIEKKFSSYLDIAFMGALDRWILLPESHAALIVLLDQFPRNIFRDTYKAFHFDKKALSLATMAIKEETFRKVPICLGYFMLMPTMHAENLEIQNLGINCFTKLLASAEDLGDKEMLESALVYAKKHRDIIKNFGRFPHRNKLLERESSIEEIQFLETKGSSF